MIKNYNQIISDKLKDGEWKPDNKLCSEVVREKLGISRASQKKIMSVRAILNSLNMSGGVVRGITSDGKIFWKKTNGEQHKEVLIFNNEIAISKSKLSLVQKSQLNIKRIEDFLSNLIVHVLPINSNEDWCVVLPPSVFEKLKRQYEKTSSAKLTTAVKNNLLDSANIIDYVDIMRHNWNFFKPIFIDKEITIGKLKEIAFMRNDIQHNRDLCEKEYVYFSYSIELFLDRFDVKKNKTTH